MNRTNNKNYAQAAAQQKNNKQASHTINPSHQNQQHHHQQVSQQNQASGPPTSSNYSSSANGKSINNSQTKPQTPHNSTMGNGNTGRSASIKQQKNSVTLPTNGHSWETAPTSLVFGSIKNTSNAQISSLPSSTSQTLTSGGGLPTTLPTKGVPTFGSLPTNTTTTPTTQATQATQATPTTVGTSGPGVNNINNNNNNNNSNGTSKSISARANEIPRTHSAPPLFQDSNNRNVGQSGHTSNVVPARTQPNNNIHQQQSTAVPPHQQSSASVNNPPLNHRKDSVSSTVSSNDGQPQFHPHHSPHHPPNHTNQHGHPAFRQHPQHHNTHKPIQQIYRPRDKQHPSPHLNPAQQPVPTQQSAMPMGPPPPHMFQMYPNHRGVVQYYMDYTGYPVAPHNMYSIPPYVPQRPPPMSQPIPPVNNVSFQKPTTNKAIQIIDPNKGAPIQIHTNNNIIQRQQQNYKREETPSAVPDKKTKESDKERPNSEDKGFSKAVPIVDPAEKNKEREEREKKERDEQERLAKEKEERERKEREERLEQERIAKEKEEQERKEREEREEQERLAKEKEERERKEREEREEQERIAKEKEEQERIEREEREKREREEQERLAKEKEERERKELEERLEQERLAKEKEEQERKEREEQERLAKEKEERERKEREEQERIAKEKEEQERKEREERERLELERIAKEKEEQERKEKEEREERERLEAAERIEKERKEAEEKALKEQEEKVLKEEDIEKKEEEEPKAKATPEEEAEKKKKAETLDKKDDKKEEKKRPGPLDLSRTTSAPAIPSAPLSALGSARIIDDLSSIQYPHGIKSPNPELNSNAEPGKFKYDRTFLMQFMTVCKEKPENLPALEAIGMEESKDDKKRTNTRSNSGPRTSSLHKGSPNQSQFSQMGEFKFTPLKTSEERFAASMRNGMPASGIFGRTALGRTGSGSTLLPPSAAMTPPSPGRTPSGRNRDNRRTGKGSHQMQGNMGQEHIAPLERTENRWVPQILNNGSNGSLPKSESESIPFESVQRKVKALLNKLTLEKFDSISDQIIDFANKSRDERDGRILREVIRLIFEKSCDESNFCAMYAQLCRKMMERVDPEIVDENVKNTEGKFVQGGTLFRKYLLNRCQEEFEKGWKVNVPVPSNEKGEPDLMSDEYYVAARAKRQGLGLIRFIGELFKLNMLTERIMHECIKKLLIFQGSPEEEEMESLCKLMNTVGEQLDHVKPNPHEQMKSTQLDHAKAKKYMESYFDRMEEISKLPNLSSRIKFMLMDVMDLRSNAWKPRRDINAPKTIAEIHEDAAKQKEEAEYLRRTTSSGGRGMPKMSEQMSRSGSSRQHRSDKGMIQSPDGWSTVGGSSSQRNKEKVGDLTKFGSVNRSKIVSLAPGGILGGLSGGAKGWSKSDNKDPNDKPVGLNRANSTTNIYSVLNSESSEGRKSSESNSSDTQKPSPPTERKKLILAPRTLKNSPPEEPVKLASKSTSGSASSSQTTEELDSKKICNSIVNMVEEYFSIWDNREVITCLKEDTPVAYHPKAIETFANKVIEKKQKDVDNVMKLFKEIVSSSTCDIDAFKDGFKATLEFLMDIGADAPMAYSFTGQLLFSTGLDFRDITELLKPLDDDMTTEKVVKGYAEALKNDVDEQNYIQKINEFDLKSLFLKKNKDDINKYIEDLGGSSKK